MEPSKTRKRFSDADKVVILRRHFLDKEPVSKICDELKLQPTQFYRWQKTFFENGEAAFHAKPRGEPVKDRLIAQLEERLTVKNEVLAELMEEHIALKKAIGGRLPTAGRPPISGMR